MVLSVGRVSFTTKTGKKVSFTTKGTKKAKNKSKSNPGKKTMAAKKKTGTKRATAARELQRIYNKTEKSIGASRIVERVLNLVGFPPEPYRSVITTGVGFARGGVPGGVGALLVSSNMIEMVMDYFGGNGTTLSGRNGDVQGL